MNEIMVSVICSTYNQKKYISQCLDSLLNQDTDFRYEIIIKDDASSDGQQNIIKEYAKKYPEKIRLLIFEDNLFSKGLIDKGWETALTMCRGKYVALCEGDDFWTDNRKLQYQVDFMEFHPEYSLCGHAAYYANEDGSLRTDKYFQLFNESKEVSIERILSSWTMATNSILYRVSARKELTVPYKGNCINGDFALITYLALNGKVFYMNRLMSAYRVCSAGSLTQLFASNLSVYKERRGEFFRRLDRLNEYTKGEYNNYIISYKNECLFDFYLKIGDAKNLKMHKDIAKNRNLKQRILWFICVYFNKVYLHLRGNYLKDG